MRGNRFPYHARAQITGSWGPFPTKLRSQIISRTHAHTLAVVLPPTPVFDVLAVAQLEQ